MVKQQSKKPLVRFPEFKNDWEHKRLAELLTEANKRNEDLKYGKEEVLSVSGELGIVNQIEHLGRSYAGVSVHAYHVVEVGDIVYTKSPLKANPFGIIKLNKGKAGIVSTLYAVYKVNHNNAYGPFIDNYFSLDANTNRYLRPLVKKGAKNDMKINNAYVLHDRIFAPDIIEQKRIASFFTILQKKITELNQKKNLLEQYKKSVMQKIFSQELRFRDNSGKEFPKWETKKLGQICSFFSGGTPTSTNKKYYSGTIPFIGSGNIYDSEVFNFITEEALKNSSAKMVKKGDLLYALYGANSGEISISKLDGAINQAILCIRNKENIVFIYYLLLFNKEKIVTKYLQGGQGNLSASIIKGLKYNFPNNKEQEKIITFLSSIDTKINAVTLQIEHTKIYKKALLQRMFCN